MKKMRKAETHNESLLQYITIDFVRQVSFFHPIAIVSERFENTCSESNHWKSVAGYTGNSIRIGNVMVNVVPCPTRLCTLICPP